MSEATPDPDSRREHLPWEAAWDQPQTVTEIDMAFPARGLELAPTPEQVTEVITAWDDETLAMWGDYGAKMFMSLFFGGPQVKQFMVDDAMDGETAWRHLQVVAGCYGFKHEHKEAALSYLASRWFASVEWEPQERPHVR